MAAVVAAVLSAQRGAEAVDDEPRRGEVVGVLVGRGQAAAGAVGVAAPPGPGGIELEVAGAGREQRERKNLAGQPAAPLL